VFEPEYDPTYPDTFDEDASIIFQYDSFFPGFVSLEFLSKPGYVSHAAADGFVRLAQFQDTTEFKNAASSFVMAYHTKGEWAKYSRVVAETHGGQMHLIP